jgi:hypothetical protein
MGGLQMTRERPGSDVIAGSDRPLLFGGSKAWALTKRRPVSFPVLRWTALIWLAVWAPIMWKTYGKHNFAYACDVSVILTVIGIWCSSALLLSSQAVAQLLIGVAWCVDAGWRLVQGHTLFGATDYMWDTRFPLAARLLSLFHVLLPIALIWTVYRLGYDKRGLWLATGIFGTLIVFSRLWFTNRNINFAYHDPFLHRAWGPAPIHMAFMVSALFVSAFLPAHFLFVKFMRAAGTSKPAQ